MYLPSFPGAFDQLVVETNDGKFPLNQLAQLVQKNPSLIAINMGPVPQVRFFSSCICGSYLTFVFDASLWMNGKSLS
jgi:hypothetical protein